LSVQLVSKIANLCDPDPPTSQTDGQTDGRHAIARLRFALAYASAASRGKNLDETRLVLLTEASLWSVNVYTDAVITDKIEDVCRVSTHYVGLVLGGRRVISRNNCCVEEPAVYTQSIIVTEVLRRRVDG